MGGGMGSWLDIFALWDLYRRAEGDFVEATVRVVPTGSAPEATPL
jgi:hypothetical protein